MRDESLTTDEWWTQHEPGWRENPAYYESLRDKAERHGKEWVRQRKREIDAYWDNARLHVAVEGWVREHGSLDNW